MNILSAFWRYWKWVCVALMTTFVVLALAAALINWMKKPSADKRLISQCIDNGGTWDDDRAECRSAA